MAKVIIMEKPFVLKPYNKKELIAIMEVSEYVFTKWLQALQPQLGQPIAKMYNVKQVQLIIEAYGIPGQAVNQAA
jgi:hypothetical protein